MGQMFIFCLGSSSVNRLGLRLKLCDAHLNFSFASLFFANGKDIIACRVKS